MGSDNDKSSVGRRSFLAAFAAAVTWGPSALARKTTDLTEAVAPVGGDLGGGWTLQRVSSRDAGALRLVAEHPSTARLANVAVCRAERGSGAMASTGHVDLFLMNDGGDGSRRTPDDEVALVRRIAERLQDAEENIPGMSRLMSRKARVETYDPIDHLDHPER
ncbi:MAG: hypothetical protein ACQEXJ_22630 [Myxococcota bacterium]